MADPLYRGNDSEFETFNEPPNDATNQTQVDLWAVRVVTALYLYYTPFLIALGTLGNLVSVFVFYSSKLRLQSTSQYLSALALSDTVFLFQLLPPWLSAARITGLFHRGGFCQVFVYISYVSCCLSAWLVVAFTVERFVAVLYPLRRNAMCTVTRARHVIITLTVLSVVLNLPVLRFAIPSNYGCNIDREYLDHAARFNMVDTVVSFTVPLAVIIVLNAWIMVGVCRLERARHQLMKAQRPARGATAVRRAGRRAAVRAAASARPSRLLGCPRSQQRVTRMLLIVSSVFVILNLPAYLTRVMAYAYDMDAEEIGGRWTALQQVLVMFFNTNFGINFLLYCLSGQNFRRALVQALPCVRRRARARAAAVRRAASQPVRAPSLSTSYISTCTEATTHGAATVVSPRPRPRHSEHFITRWTFDNSRQRRAASTGAPDAPAPDPAPEALEMRDFGTI